MSRMSFRDHLLSLDESSRSDAVYDELVRLLTAVLPATVSIQPDSPLAELGLTSKAAIALSNELSVGLGISFPQTLAFDHPTISAIVQFAIASLGSDGINEDAPAPCAAPPPDPSSQPIAVIGVSCRFPSAPDVDEFWRLLHEGRSAVSDVPSDRWPATAFSSSSMDEPGTMYTTKGCFLSDVAGFDPLIFGICGQEAASMDPQHRLLLECSWSALESAGIPPRASKDARPIGVFVGQTLHDYELLKARVPFDQVSLAFACHFAQMDSYFATGSSCSVTAGRISYMLGLSGPALTVDTACSSSLVAMHLAAQSLRSGECEVALAAGVNVICAPDLHIQFSRSHMLSPNGRCATFDEAADGYVRGEGCGVLVLKPLAAAKRDGDRVLGVVLGSAVNQDGRTSSFTRPNGPSQQHVIRQALTSASLSASDIDLVEAHGTGTKLGDPIEAQALGAVFHDPLFVRSVKTNIGHLEGAAGVAGVLSALLSMSHGEIPPHINFSKLNSYIPATLPLTIPTQPTPWPATTTRRWQRTAGVSSFGFSGTNAHVVLASGEAEAEEEEDEEEEEEEEEAGAPPFQALILSGFDQPALDALAKSFVVCLQAMDQNASPASVCRTAATGRTHFGSSPRLAVCGDTIGALVQQLEAGPVITTGKPPTKLRVAFGFCGAGDSTVMTNAFKGCKALYNSHTVFRETLERLDTLLRPIMRKTPLLVALGVAKASASDQALALFAAQCAAAALWRSWGVEPAVVSGTGEGRFAAALTTGVMDEAAAVALAAGQSLPSGTVLRRARMTLLDPSGTPVTAEDACSPTYWAKTVPAGPVESVGALPLCMGPAALAPQWCTPEGCQASLDGWASLMSDVARLWVTEGLTVDWDAFHAGQTGGKTRTVVPLPGHPFAHRTKHWLPVVTPQAAPKPQPAQAPVQEQVKLSQMVLKWLPTSAAAPPLPPQGQRRGPRRTWVVSGASHIAPLVHSHLDRAGHRVITVEWKRNARVELTDSGAWTVDPSSPSSLLMLLRRSCSAVPGTGPLPELGGWIHLDGLVDTHSAADLSESLLAVVRVAESAQLPRVCVVTRGSVDAGGPLSAIDGSLWGLMRSASFDCQSTLLRSIDLDPALDSRALTAEAMVVVLEAVAPMVVPWETEVAIREGRRLVARLAPFEPAPTVTTESAVPSALAAPSGDEVEIKIEARSQFGGFAGTVTRAGSAAVGAAAKVGAVVCGLQQSNADYVLESAAHLVIPPVRLTPTLAAAQPVPFLTAAIATEGLARGSRVLLWPAVGSTCMAAIRLGEEQGWISIAAAPACDAARLKALGIPANRIVASDGTQVTHAVQKATGGRGVDLVLAVAHEQSSQADFLRLALPCLRRGGRWVEVLPITDTLPRVPWSEDQVHSRRPDVSYDMLDPLKRLKQDTTLTLRLQKLMDRIGQSLTALPAHSVGNVASLENTQLITGGSGALGLQLAEWLGKQGAQHLVLVSRRGSDKTAIDRIKATGVASVRTLSLDVSDAGAVASALGPIGRGDASHPPLGAIWHLAGVLGDEHVSTLSNKRLLSTLKPKVDGSWNLHLASAALAPHLTRFVMFSSATATIGNAGQVAYGTGNAFMDALAVHRRSVGLPASSVAWGPWTIGMAAGARSHLARIGLAPIEPRDAFGLLGPLLDSGAPHVVVVAARWNALAAGLAQAAGGRMPPKLLGIAPGNSSGGEVVAEEAIQSIGIVGREIDEMQEEQKQEQMRIAAEESQKREVQRCQLEISQLKAKLAVEPPVQTVAVPAERQWGVDVVVLLMAVLIAFVLGQLI